MSQFRIYMATGKTMEVRADHYEIKKGEHTVVFYKTAGQEKVKLLLFSQALIAIERFGAEEYIATDSFRVHTRTGNVMELPAQLYAVKSAENCIVFYQTESENEAAPRWVFFISGVSVIEKVVCIVHGGSLKTLRGVTSAQAVAVINVSPPGKGQNYQPFQVPGLGTWKTQDQSKGGHQGYSRVDAFGQFSWYSCSRYPNGCEE